MIQTDKYQTSDRHNLLVQHCYRGLPLDGILTSVEKSARSTILAMAGLVEYTDRLCPILHFRTESKIHFSFK